MTGSNHIVAQVVTSVPAYCNSSPGHPEIHTPAQWATCAKIGWGQPVTTAAHAGFTFGSDLIPVLMVIFLIVAAVGILRGLAGRVARPRSS
jgi:hypothetical protein